jgi:hypothetical protein
MSVVEALPILLKKARLSERAYNVMSSGERVLVGLPLNRLDLLVVPVAIGLTRCDEMSIRAMQIVAAELSCRGLP